MNFTQDFFINNRNNLFEKMENSSVLILGSNDQYPKNGDQYYTFRQQSDLYYLTGVKQEETILLMLKNKEGYTKEILFLLKPNLKMETWEGKKLSKSDAYNISGISNTLWNKSFNREFKLISNQLKIAYLLAKDAFSLSSELNTKHIRLKNIIVKDYPAIKVKSPRSMLNALRLIKSEAEIQMMQKAVDITNLAFLRILSEIKPQQFEYEVEAEISYVFRKNGANGHAYEPIVATGINACSLHYLKNDSEMKAGDLLLMDFGVDNNYYAADLSRTIPVSGKFTERQKQLYQLVLDVQKKSIALYVPGNTIDIVNKKTNAWMEEALSKIGLLKNKKDIERFFPHGTSHFLGIDVHDVGVKTIEFEEGMVLTCEPGLYIEEENIGIRIENDIVVRNTPFDLMKNTVREIDEIEALMIRK